MHDLPSPSEEVLEGGVAWNSCNEALHVKVYPCSYDYKAHVAMDLAPPEH
eukprot:CAMPEP_0179325072 /NCGR_PEP_ID=MMETSP0797-20121207/60661_1 /TAXON_ID=47934 /ORGANISM="Dinophysis acuminata, Strain DAEP01" /LENGTH=49 /DNA_ID= /DNA_START= /DNA_END= /DNA_ORIENTATION=